MAGLSVVVAAAGVAALIQLWRPPAVLRSLPDSLTSAGVYEDGPPTGNAFVGHCAVVAPASGGSVRAAEILLVEHFRRSGWRIIDPPPSEWVTSSGASGDAVMYLGPLSAYLKTSEGEAASRLPFAEALRRADVDASVVACIEDYGHPLRGFK